MRKTKVKLVKFEVPTRICNYPGCDTEIPNLKSRWKCFKHYLLSKEPPKGWKLERDDE